MTIGQLAVLTFFACILAAFMNHNFKVAPYIRYGAYAVATVGAAAGALFAWWSRIFAGAPLATGMVFSGGMVYAYQHVITRILRSHIQRIASGDKIEYEPTEGGQNEEAIHADDYVGDAVGDLL